MDGEVTAILIAMGLLTAAAILAQILLHGGLLGLAGGLG